MNNVNKADSNLVGRVRRNLYLLMMAVAASYIVNYASPSVAGYLGEAACVAAFCLATYWIARSAFKKADRKPVTDLELRREKYGYYIAGGSLLLMSCFARLSGAI